MRQVDVEIRRVRAEEWKDFRQLRLRALRDAPQAFLTTLTQAEMWPEEVWREAARRASADERWCTFVADEGGRLLGMTTGHFPDERHQALDDPAIPVVIQMWVDPATRRAGVGTGLVRAVLRWAGERGSAVVRLDVNAADPGAIAFYRSVGFRETGRRERFAERDMEAIEMEAATSG